MIKRIAVSCLCVVFVPIGAWVAGFDFNERGFEALFIYFFCLSVFAFVFICPYWDD